jgi:phytanoyl-CoA hydroxylase
MIKKLKLTYLLYNLFHPNQLRHNLPFYKQLGLRKRYFSPISSSDFEGLDENLLKSDTKAVSVSATALYQSADEATQQSILAYDETGFIKLANYLPAETVDVINAAIANGLTTKQLTFKNGNKIMFAIHQLNVLKNIGLQKDLITFLSALLGGEATLFQSINFINGSEQPTHSDSIHMTTFPLGGLLGVWIALEDITDENGPLHYYPGSHKLPYYLNSDYDNEGNALFLGNKSYKAYERMIEEKIVAAQLKKETFLAKKGDVLIWHANLFHGGEPHINKLKTRKSVVFHYYLSQCICYHEISQRPALIKKII